MRTNTFTIETRKGDAEGAIAYEYLTRTWFDRILGRQRVKYGIGLCSPKDFNGRHTQFHNIGFFTLKIEGKPFYKPGRTEEIARGRCLVGSAGDLAGILTVKASEGLGLSVLHDLIVEAAPASWWKGERPFWGTGSGCS